MSHAIPGRSADGVPTHHRLLPAVALALAATFTQHLMTSGSQMLTGSHLRLIILDVCLAFPVAFAAVWLGQRWRANLVARGALTAVAYCAMAVPLAVVQGLAHLAAGAAGHTHGASTDLGALTGAGLRATLQAQPAVLLTAVLALAVIGYASRAPEPRRAHPVRAVLGALAALVMAVGAQPFLPSASADAATGDCATATRRTYTVNAINVDITLNRFGDHDPYGYMYVLADQEDEVRAQEAALKAAALSNDPNGAKVSTGLGRDPIQPMVLRARLGECVVIDLTNKLTAPPRGGPGLGGVPIITQPGPAGAQVPAVSIDLQGVAYDAAGGAGGQSIGNNATNRLAKPGETRQYRFFLDPLQGEGAHVIRSGGESTQLTAHGLFGAVIAETAGARWFDPVTGVDQTANPNWSNWEAMIQPANSPSFREFGIIYHEVGDENFNVRRPQRETGQAGVAPDPGDGNGSPLPMIDAGPVSTTVGSGAGTSSYRPASRALNYRSEPFFRRLQQLAIRFGATLSTLDEAEGLGYSSYIFGDPATPTPRSYLGEPTKTRLMHAGFEQLHVHHLHGGGDRWRLDPGADDTDLFGGLRKVPIQNARSIRLDSQGIGPLESYNLEHECGAGGCQQAAGDFLWHCHIAHHYIAGMWGFWRVFDTRRTDLAVLPGRTALPSAVTSAGLIGRTIEGRTVIASGTSSSTQVTLADLVEPQLPPQGVRFNDTDATVWDWQKTGPSTAPVYVGEPEDTQVWSDYTSPAPGVRPDILFNPNTGRPTWPLFRPHLGKRPPFSPRGHTGTPYLGDTVTSTRPDGLCPAAAPVRKYNVTSIAVPIQQTARDRDENGEVYVLNEDKTQVLADAASGTRYPDPLTIRSNVGDCVAVTLSSELNPAIQPKINMHTHFVQFDPQASDGVITGFSYEQSIYNDSREGRTLTTVNSPSTITVSNVTNLRPGIFIAVGVGRTNIEIKKITVIVNNQLTFDTPLAAGHVAGEPVTVEFVQYRWYSDVDSGTVFWHDHTNGIESWAHGLFGSHIIEPAGSTYHNPATGAQVRSGTIVDVHTSGSVAAGQSGSFREFMIFLHNGRRGRTDLHATVNQDQLPFNSGQECEEGSINLRAAPIGERTPPDPNAHGGFDVANPTALPENGSNPAATQQRWEFNGQRCRNTFRRAITGAITDDPNADTTSATVTTVDPYVFSSVKYGDPMTPLLRAYVGDPVVIRTIGLGERNEALRIQGHRFRMERFNFDGKLMDAATTGISERFDYSLDGGAGGQAGMPGDYLYYSTRTFALESGAWGILRVHDRLKSDLQPLPNRTPSTGTGFPRLTAATGNTQANPGPNPPSAFRSDGTVNTNVVESTKSPCPSTARAIAYDISVFNKALPTKPNSDTNGVIYSLTSDRAAIVAGTKPVEPLVLRVNRGDCVSITLRNQTTAGSLFGGTRAGFDLSGKLLANPQLSAGSAVGLNPDTTVAIGSAITYRFYADRETGTSVFQNLGSPASLRHGGYGLLIVEPNGSTWSDSFTNAALGPNRTSTQAIIRVGTTKFREFALTMQTTDQQYARSIIPYIDQVAGTGINSTFTPANPPTADKGFSNINYTTEPLTVRLGLTDNPNRPDTNPNPKADYGTPFSSIVHGAPATPTFRAYAGDPVIIRMAAPASDQVHVFTVSGHSFPLEPNMWTDASDHRSAVIDARAVAAGETLDVELVGGAGGTPHFFGDYFYGDGRQPFTAAGMWGIFRVHRVDPTPLPDLARL